MKLDNQLAAMRADFIRKARSGVPIAIAEGERVAIERSSGTSSLAEMRRADHPFAQRHPAPMWDPSTIHSHTGKFKRAWRSESAGREGRVYNDDSAADFLQPGTIFMHHRPIDEKIGAAMVARLNSHLDEVFGG